MSAPKVVVSLTDQEARALLMAISEYRMGCIDNGQGHEVATLNRIEDKIQAARREP